MVIAGVLIGLSFPSGQSYAQENSGDFLEEQVTISTNLEDDPLAQDILRKIEQAKKWISDYEKRENKEKEVEQKRLEALEILQKDLNQWEELWKEFTFYYAFEQKQGIFWDQYNFTHSKITAGKIALQKVLENGGNAEEARSAYAEAAKTKRSEIIAANSLFNVKHGFAHYNQQILFESDGQFHDIVSGDQLRKYYQDFRTNPVYLNSNPDDEASWEELSQSIHDECNTNEILIHRFSTDDYICVTEQTSEMWERHNMGKPMIEYVTHSSEDELTLERFREDTIKEKIKNINNKIDTTYMYFEEKIDELTKKYDYKFKDNKDQQRENEKIIIDEFNSTDMSGDVFQQKIEKIRSDYKALEAIISNEKNHALEIMKFNHELHMNDFLENFDQISHVDIIWDSKESKYKAIRVLD